MRNRLKPYRRHEQTCKHRAKPRAWSRENHHRCACPVHCEGTLSGERIRTSIGTTHWAEALAICGRWERAGRIDEPEPAAAISIADAVARFIESKTRIGGLNKSGLSHETARKYTQVLTKFVAFAAARGIIHMQDVDALLVDAFIEDLAKGYAQPTTYERHGKIKTFLRYCYRKDITAIDLANKIEPVEASTARKPAYSQQQQIAILAEAADPLDKAFILFQRYTGFAIEDAANCPKANLGPLEWFTLPDGRQIELARVWIQHRAKLGDGADMVEAWIPRFVVEALDAFPHKSRTHWFKSDRANPKSAAKVMSARLLPIFKAAGVEGRSHGFRRTLSASVLSLKGMTREDAALLLGNTPDVVGRHYDPRTQERQLRGKMAAALALANDPKVKTSGTSAAHEESTRAN